MNKLTAECSINKIIKSEYGEITYLDWCKKEVKRINKAGGSVELWESGAMCAVKNK